MPELLTPSDSLILGWDFSTGSVKAVALTLTGEVAHEVRLPTDLWTQDGVSELSPMLLEGQARATVRGLAAFPGRYVAGGISATHHSAGRIDRNCLPLRRLICWNDQTLAQYHARGLARLGGQDRAMELTGGPWAVRYSLSHLMKDEQTLPADAWKRTWRMLPHGPMAAGFLTGNFNAISISSAASTGILDLRTNQWRREMLDCLESPEYRELAWKSLPPIVEMDEPLGVAAIGSHPVSIYPTLDDQAAGLVGGGAVEPGHVAVILGNSAVVNSSSSTLPAGTSLDAMKLNWGPYLWMRCYSNGAQFLDRIVGSNPDWSELERLARAVPPGCHGTMVLPFILTEPSLGVHRPRYEWSPGEPAEIGARVRASFEAIAYLIGLAVQAHDQAGQRITRVSVSGGIARSDLMVEILASVLNRPLERLVSSEGPALGAAVAALAGHETQLRRNAGNPEPFTVSDAVKCLVKFREPMMPNPAWVDGYRQGLSDFAAKIRSAA